MKRFVALGLLVVSAAVAGKAWAAKETSFTEEDRSRLIRLDAKVETGFEQIEKRFEQIDKRFESIERQLDRFVNLMIAFFLGQIGLVGAVIGFAYWDRRTIIGKAKQEAVAEVEKEGRLKDLIHALRQLSKTDENLARVLRDFKLL